MLSHLTPSFAPRRTPDEVRSAVVGPDWAAVALIAVSSPSGLELMMIQRAKSERDPWSGHMAFPGGKWESQDEDLIATACREVREETGMSLDPSSCLGALETVRSPPGLRRLQVCPLVFELPSWPSYQLSDAEVASVHFFSWSDLQDPQHRGRRPWRQLHLPQIELQGCVIWGMSLRMIDDLARRLA